MGSYRRRGWIGSLILLVIVVFVLLGDFDREPNPDSDGDDARQPVHAKVLEVTDGDTIEVQIGGRVDDVRYIGIDTPEVDPSIGVECFGKEASELNERLVGGETVRLAFDDELRDRYDRLLAYVFTGELLVNAEIVRRGYARTLEIEPNTNRAELFARLERQAGRAGRGLWGAC